MGVIVQLGVSPGGVPKRAVAQARVTAEGLAGDGHRAPMHGGVARAVCLFAAERIETLAAEGHPLAPGAVGENITTRGIDWDRVAPGVRLRLGEVMVEITSYTRPCKTIRHCFVDGFFNRILQERFPGWSRTYARVVQPGVVRAGDVAELIEARVRR
jgi:MOSC domain-containing protein YiiM